MRFKELIRLIKSDWDFQSVVKTLVNFMIISHLLTWHLDFLHGNKYNDAMN